MGNRYQAQGDGALGSRGVNGSACVPSLWGVVERLGQPRCRSAVEVPKAMGQDAPLNGLTTSLATRMPRVNTDLIKSQ